MDAKGTLVQSCWLPLGCRPHTTGLSQQKEKNKVILIFCTFCSCSNICAKAVQTDMCVGELVDDPSQAVSSTSHRRLCSFTHQLLLRLVYTSIRCKGQHCIWLLHKPCKNPQHSSLKCTCKESTVVTYPLLLKALLPTGKPWLWKKINLSAEWCSNPPNRDGSSCASVSLPKEVMYLWIYSVALLCALF